jgi:hypothetical protein
MLEHVRDDELMDAAEGTASGGVRRHIKACPACRERVAEAATGWDLARAADVPEPSPLFWEAFRRQVGRRVGSERRWRPVVWAPALAAAAAATIAIGVLAPRPGAVQPVSTLPAWSASLTAGDENGLAQLGNLDAAEPDALAAAGCRRLTECLSGLSEEETIALAEVLTDEFGTAEEL